MTVEILILFILVIIISILISRYFIPIMMIKSGGFTKMPIVFITGNKNKLKEASDILGISLESKEISLDEIQDIDVQQVVKKKVEDAYSIVKKPLIVEDTGLYIESVNSGVDKITLKRAYPGALIRSYLEAIGIENIAKLHGGSAATAQTIVGYCDDNGNKFYSGDIKGKIAREPKGDNGFGWDKIFIPDGGERTFAEMSPDEKNEWSMRAIAFRKLAADLV